MTAPHCCLPLVIVAAALLAGCNPAAKAIGTWEVDVDRARAAIPAAGESPLTSLLANAALFVPMKGELAIKADGTWTSEVGLAANLQSQSGTWRFLKAEGSTLVLMAKRAAAEEESEFKLQFVDDDHVDASGILGNQGLPLKRKKEA